MKEWGLPTKKIDLLIADDADGLTSALEHLLPNIPIQHCMVHKMRSVLGKTSHKHKPLLAEELKSSYRDKDKKAAIQRAIEITKKWYVKEPKVCSSLIHHFKYTLTYLDLPLGVGYTYRTTNILERELREVYRRIKVFNSTFNDTGTMKRRYANSITNNLYQNYPAIQNPKLHNDA